MCCRSCATSLNARSIMFVACHTTKPAWHTVFPVANITLETILSDLASENGSRTGNEGGFRRAHFTVGIPTVFP